MKKSLRRKILNLGVHSKALYTQQSNLALRQRHPATHKNNTGNIKGWYQARKQAQIRLRNMSTGNLVIHESGYRGDHERHWIQDGRCEHVFCASLKEVFIIGADNICPFCQIPNDMHHCGSVGAVQQMVECLSYGNVKFLAENELKGPDDYYHFACLIHKFQFEATYRDFIRDPENLCHICGFKNGK